MTQTQYKKPIPAITAEMAPFFEAARQGRLVVQRCASCGQLRFPAREICTQCLSRTSEWVVISGGGEVFSFNVMHQVYHPGFADEIPYAVVLIKTDEGVKMTSNLVGVPPDQVRIGMRVKVVFESITDEISLPKFTPA